MSTWIIGDLQGCADSFEALRTAIHFDPARDTIYLVGDLVNRGPASLETLRWVFQHQHCVFPVLGNHDLHLLWCALGRGVPKGRDTLAEILQAPDRDELIAWLQKQPLIRQWNDALMVHAGIHPQWSIHEAIQRANAAQAKLQSSGAGAFLDRMRSRNPIDREEAQAFETLDVFTRMRALQSTDLSLDLRYNGTLDELPQDRVAWFDVPSARARPTQVFFGHWAALGVHEQPPYFALDSGCVWGNSLTAWRFEDGQQVTQPAIDAPVQMTDGQRSKSG